MITQTRTNARRHTHTKILTDPEISCDIRTPDPPPRSGCWQGESLFSGALKTSLRLPLLRTGMICAPDLTLLEMRSGRRATASYSEELLSGAQSGIEARVNRHNRALCLFSCLGWNIVYPRKIRQFGEPRLTAGGLRLTMLEGQKPIRITETKNTIRKKKQQQHSFINSLIDKTLYHYCISVVSSSPPGTLNIVFKDKADVRCLAGNFTLFVFFFPLWVSRLRWGVWSSHGDSGSSGAVRLHFLTLCPPWMACWAAPGPGSGLVPPLAPHDSGPEGCHGNAGHVASSRASPTGVLFWCFTCRLQHCPWKRAFSPVTCRSAARVSVLRRVRGSRGGEAWDGLAWGLRRAIGTRQKK